MWIKPPRYLPNPLTFLDTAETRQTGQKLINFSQVQYNSTYWFYRSTYIYWQGGLLATTVIKCDAGTTFVSIAIPSLGSISVGCFRATSTRASGLQGFVNNVANVAAVVFSNYIALSPAIDRYIVAGFRDNFSNLAFVINTNGEFECKTNGKGIILYDAGGGSYPAGTKWRLKVVDGVLTLEQNPT